MTDVPRLSCDEVAELTGGYALDALSPEERHAVEAHVDECQLHEEISQLRLAAASVALSVDEVAPPSGLRDRVLAIPDAGVVAFEAEPAASGLLEFIRRPAVGVRIRGSAGCVRTPRRAGDRQLDRGRRRYSSRRRLGERRRR